MDNLVKYYDNNAFSFISMEKLEELKEDLNTHNQQVTI